MTEPVKTHGDWASNAEMVRDGLVPLGWLADDKETLDMTFGLGKWWTLYQPPKFVGIDIVEAKSPYGYAVDYRDTGFAVGAFDAITLDGPYRLNGTPDTESDNAFGVDEPATWQERHDSIMGGIKEAGRLLVRSGPCGQPGVLIVKCQNQVCSGKKRWQTRIFANYAETVGFRQADELQYTSYREQPAGRRQVHSRINYSTALIFVKVA